MKGYSKKVSILIVMSKEIIISDLISVFTNPLNIMLPSDFRVLMDLTIKDKQVYSTIENYELLEVLANYEFIFEVDRIEYEDGHEVIKYIPTDKLESVWIAYSKEIERNTLDVIPFKGTIEQYADKNGLDIKLLKSEIIEVMNITSYESLDKHDDKLVDLVLDIQLIAFDENENKVKEWRTNDRWFIAFNKWLRD